MKSWIDTFTCMKQETSDYNSFQTAVWVYLSLEAPSASTMGSAISSIDCRMEATTMKRMMLRRKALWMTCSSISPVCTARIKRVIPSVMPLRKRARNWCSCSSNGKSLCLQRQVEGYDSPSNGLCSSLLVMKCICQMHKFDDVLQLSINSHLIVINDDCNSAQASEDYYLVR